MVDKMFDKKEIGIRIRNARNAKGWTLEELAEKADTSYQNISKLEKNGTSDLAWIRPLGAILGTDLEVDTIDVDSHISEIGKEILYQLIIHNGMCEMGELEERYMYSLSKEHITREIVKLSNSGLIVREQYESYEDEFVDVIFIKAKGIISLKNMQLNTAQSVAIEEMLKYREPEPYEDEESATPYTQSYESLIGDFNSYAELIQSHKENDIEKLLRNIDVIPADEPTNPYRSFYLDWLKKKYQYEYESEHEWLDYFGWFTSNFYETIISRMMFGLTNEKIIDYIKIEKKIEYRNQLFEKYEHTDNPLFDPIEFKFDGNLEHWAYRCSYYTEAEDGLDERYDSLMDNVFENSIAPDFIDNLRKYALKYNFDYSDLGRLFYTEFTQVTEQFDSEEERSYFELLKEIWLEFGPEGNVKQAEYDDIYSCEKFFDILEQHNCKYPSELYSTDEIRDFIETSFPPAKSESELKIDNYIKELSQIKPEILDYFVFPKSWENNGLADLVRKNSGLF